MTRFFPGARAQKGWVPLLLPWVLSLPAFLQTDTPVPQFPPCTQAGSVGLANANGRPQVPESPSGSDLPMSLDCSPLGSSMTEATEHRAFLLEQLHAYLQQHTLTKRQRLS